MAKVTVKGVKYGREVTAVCEEIDGQLEITFDGKKHEIYEFEFWDLLERGTCSMGNYYPTEKNILTAYIVLMGGFFDYEPESSLVDGDIGEIPTEDEDDIPGIVY